MAFIDEAKIHVSSGDGGNGCVAFRREAHVPRGGPSGGDGGDGGSVIAEADPQLSTLLDYKYKRRYAAPRGEDGRGRDQYGKRGEDLVLRVPVGTAITDAATGELIADLATAGQRVTLARGGRGGLGNIHFAKAWDQAPRQSTEGTPGEERELTLELKLLADCGIMGFPSVGKSTLIAAVSRARPKIADYPFTTLVPNLGVVVLDDERQMVLADIPGLIAGAAEGAGLGHRFLRHVERTRVLVHLIEANSFTGPERDPIGDFETLNRELERYAPELASKPQIVALSKADLTETRDAYPALREAFAARGIDLRLISPVTREGVAALLDAIWLQLA
jgi:GTP-binding protein